MREGVFRPNPLTLKLLFKTESKCCGVGLIRRWYMYIEKKIYGGFDNGRHCDCWTLSDSLYIYDFP